MSGLRSNWLHILATWLLLLCCAKAIEIVDFSSSYSANGDVFMPGPYSVGKLEVPPWGEDPLKPVVVAIPTKTGKYPVIIFLHDFFPVRNFFYWQLLEHIASHGYIAVAPQMYDIAGWDTTNEMTDVDSIVAWLDRDGLLSFLPPPLHGVKPNTSNIVLAGHGRGAKVAFGTVMGIVAPPPPSHHLKYAALVALDPIEGTAERATTPSLLNHTANSFERLTVPNLIVGTGLGPAEYRVLPTCAPRGMGHAEFFNETRGPAYHFVAADYGHQDVLDDSVEWVACFLCKCTSPVGPMRRFAAGIVVAFLKATLDNDASALMKVYREPGTAPVVLEEPRYKSVQFNGGQTEYAVNRFQYGSFSIMEA